jgi:hypothetical protein
MIGRYEGTWGTVSVPAGIKKSPGHMVMMGDNAGRADAGFME